MNTVFLLMAQHGSATIPLDDVRKHYFSHLSPDQFLRKLNNGEIKLPVIRSDPNSRKSALYVSVTDLAAYVDDRRAAAIKEMEQLT